MRNPSPIMFRMGVFSRMLSLGVFAGRNRRFRYGNIQMKVCWAVDAIAQILNGDNMRGIILAILETRHADNTVAVGAGESPPKVKERIFNVLSCRSKSKPSTRQST